MDYRVQGSEQVSKQTTLYQVKTVMIMDYLKWYQAIAVNVTMYIFLKSRTPPIKPTALIETLTMCPLTPFCSPSKLLHPFLSSHARTA